MGIDIEAGDVIVFPSNADRVSPFLLWASAKPILYDFEVAVEVNSFWWVSN
jgi:hypothetical protein